MLINPFQLALYLLSSSFVSVIQILLHQRLKQNAPLERLYLVPYSQLKLYLTYISVHVVILMLMLLMISLLMHQPLSILFYLKH